MLRFAALLCLYLFPLYFKLFFLYDFQVEFGYLLGASHHIRLLLKQLVSKWLYTFLYGVQVLLLLVSLVSVRFLICRRRRLSSAERIKRRKTAIRPFANKIKKRDCVPFSTMHTHTQTHIYKVNPIASLEAIIARVQLSKNIQTEPNYCTHCPRHSLILPECWNFYIIP